MMPGYSYPLSRFVSTVSCYSLLISDLCVCACVHLCLSFSNAVSV